MCEVRETRTVSRMAPAKHVAVEQMLTVKQVAETLQMDTWSVRDLIHAGQLVAHNTGRGERALWRIKPSDLERYLAVRSSAA